MSVNLHYQPLAADPRWREAVRRFFLAIAENLHTFFASAEVTRGSSWNGRSLWSDGETEWPIMPARVQGWMGLPPYPLWWAWYGEPYRGLILGHLSGGEVTETAGGKFHQLAAEPLDRDELTGATTRRAGLRSVTSWTRSDLLAHVRANDGRVRPTPIDPSDCITSRPAMIQPREPQHEPQPESAGSAARPSPRPRHRLSQHPPTWQPPSPSPSPTRQPQPPSNLPERARLLAALADAGVTENDYRLIEKARRLVDRLNAHLSARGATLAYAVTCNPVGPVQTRVVPDRLVLEDA